jgi:hypothetical protein
MRGMRRIARIIGVLLVVLSLFSIVQTVRDAAFWIGGDAEWDEGSVQRFPFSFAGRTVTLTRAEPLKAWPDSAIVAQERVLIDGIEVGQRGAWRQRNWPVAVGMRSPHWTDKRIFINRASHDSSLWIARRLQLSDSVMPIFEFVTIDARGRYATQTVPQNKLDVDYRLARMTYLVGENGPAWFPFSVFGLLMLPILFLVYPMGTLALGALLMRLGKA